MKSNFLIIVLSSLIIVLAYIGLENTLIKNNRYVSLFTHTQNLETIVKKINEQTTADEKFKLAIIATLYATNHTTLYLSSDAIENVFTTIAQEHDIELYSKVIPNSVLHIATELYSTGGHTRVIERWIENSPKVEKHSLILTRNPFVTERLKKAITEKNGQIILLNRTKSDIYTALELRRIASQYEKIVLHIHPEDYLPLIAFGTSKFSRPIIFFNHADHRFWLGVSIADHIIDLREEGKELTTKIRGSNLNSIINLPIDKKTNMQSIDKKQNRILFDLPSDRPIIFTSGAAHKFQPIGNLDYSLFMEKVLKKKKDVFFVLVGPSKSLFKNLDRIPEQNYKFFSPMPNEQYIKCLSVADIVIDSIPMSGFLTLVDAISLNIPILSLKRKFSHQDFIIKSKAYMPSMDEMVTETIQILSSKEKQLENISNVKDLLEKVSNVELYKKQIHDLYEKVKTHAVHPFKSGKRTYGEMMF